jgi:hypothetical protein
MVRLHGMQRECRHIFVPLFGAPQPFVLCSEGVMHYTPVKSVAFR